MLNLGVNEVCEGEGKHKGGCMNIIWVANGFHVANSTLDCACLLL